MAVKTRTKKTSPNTASTKRREAQALREASNKANIRDLGQFSTTVTPWEKSKAKRFRKRLEAGKTESWLKRSKYKTSGKHAVTELKPDTTKVNRSQRDDRRTKVEASNDISYMGGTMYAGIDF